MTCFILGKWRHSPTFIYVQYTISAGKAQGVVVKMNQQARAYRDGAPPRPHRSAAAGGK